MSNRPLLALITCEVTEEFLNDLKERNVQYELDGWGKTGRALSESQLIEKAIDCDIVIAEVEVLNKKVLESLPKLKMLGVSRGTPVNVDVEFCKSNNIYLVNTPGRNADSVADYCLAMMLDLSRKLSASNKHLTATGWMFEEKLPYLEFRGHEIGNLKVGLFGLGQIGNRVAKRLKAGFSTDVYFFDPFVESSQFATKVETLEKLFEVCDIVSLHAPVIAETKNSVNRNLLSKLGEKGILINSARANLIIEEDLYESLNANEIYGAALDVFWTEPIDVSSKWLKMPNVICTPHIAGASLDVVANHCKAILQGIDNWLSSTSSRREI